MRKELHSNFVELFKEKDYSFSAEHGRKLTQRDISRATGINPSTLNKILTGAQGLNTEQIIKLANYFEVSCDRLLTGNDTAYQQANLQFGLNQKAQLWLHKMNEDNPDFIKMLNIILGNELIADTLFRALMIYVNAVMIKISPLTSQNPTDFIYIDSKSGDKIIKHLSSEHILNLLEYIKNEWEKPLKYDIKIKVPAKHKNTESEARFIQKKKERLLKYDIVYQNKKVELNFRKLKLLLNREKKEEEKYAELADLSELQKELNEIHIINIDLEK